MVFAQVRLEPDEESKLLTAATTLANEVDRLEDVSALDRASAMVMNLPTRVRKLVALLRTSEESLSAILVSGANLGPVATMPTPRTFGEHDWRKGTQLADSTLFLLGALVGTPYCFASQQRGRLILDVIPLPGHESDQLGCSSTTALEWHNEDAFHPLRADYSLLLCIRNQQRVATRLVSASDLELSAEVLRQLREPQFAIVPDVSHSYQYNAATTGVMAGSEPAFKRIEAREAALPRAAVLDGSGANPQICVDFAYMPEKMHSRPANSALSALRLAMERTSRSVVLASGDILIIDNRRCVHGRESFGARYDGTDRWLRRLNVARELPRVITNQVTEGTLRIG